MDEEFRFFVIIEDIPTIPGKGAIAKRQLKVRPIFRTRQEAEEAVKNVEFGVVIPVRKKD